MSATLGLALVLPLGAGVLWLAYRGLQRAARPQVGGAPLSQWLLLLFAWSFLFGVVMRWVRLAG